GHAEHTDQCGDNGRQQQPSSHHVLSLMTHLRSPFPVSPLSDSTRDGGTAPPRVVRGGKLHWIADEERGMDVRALVFDVFGTVVDWRGGVAREVRRLLPRVGAAAL